MTSPTSAQGQQSDHSEKATLSQVKLDTSRRQSLPFEYRVVPSPSAAQKKVTKNTDNMTVEMQLSRGAIEQINRTKDTSGTPVVQVCELKKISQPNAKPDAPPRYRLAISDGVHFQQAMLATQLNTLIDQGAIALNTLIKLHDFICNKLHKKRILIILTLEVVGKLSHKIGNPIALDAALDREAAENANGGAGNGQMNFGGGQQQNQGNNSFGENKNGFNAQPKQSGFGNQPKQETGGFGGNSWNAPKGNPYAMGGSGVMAKASATPTSMYRPIQSINPYQNGWTIRGRCTYKGELRKFQNARGEGTVVSFELSDESGSIRITGFTQQAQTIEESVHLNKIYKVSRGSLRQANERWNRSSSSFEMTLDRNSVLEELHDDGSFMKVQYKFTKIADLCNVPVKGECDVVGVVTNIGPMSEIIIRSTGEPCNKRSITISDDSNSSVELTLWRKQAETLLTENDIDRHPVVVIRKASRGDFGGVCLNLNHSSCLELDPSSLDEANRLRNWYESGGYNASATQSLSGGGGGGGKITGPRKSLTDAKEQDVDPVFGAGGGSQGSSATFVTRAYVGFVNSKNDFYYPSDPETKKKLTNTGPGFWMSESTGRTLSDAEVVWRYVLSMKVMDHSSSHWVSAFDEVGQVLFGKTAAEFRQLKDTDPTLADQIIEDATFRPMLMKVSVRERIWKEEQQIRYTLVRAEPIDYVQEGRALVQEITSHGVM